MSTSDAHPVTRGHKKKERTRQQLIRAAVEVVAERGEAFTAADVAERAGVSNGTFYNYFEDRSELIAAVVPEVLTAWAVESADLVDEVDPARRFAAISALTLARVETNPDAFRALLRIDAAQQAITHDDALAHMRADISTGIAEGRFRGPLDASLFDIVAGGLLLAVRRTLDLGADADHHRRVVARLLVVLGIDEAEADTVAVAAVAGASETLRRN